MSSYCSYIYFISLYWDFWPPIHLPIFFLTTLKPSCKAFFRKCPLITSLYLILGTSIHLYLYILIETVQFIFSLPLVNVLCCSVQSFSYVFFSLIGLNIDLWSCRDLASCTLLSSYYRIVLKTCTQYVFLTYIFSREILEPSRALFCWLDPLEKEAC